MAGHFMDSTMSLVDYGDVNSCSMLSLNSINSSSTREPLKSIDEFDRQEFVFCLTRKCMINNRQLMAAIQYLNPEYTIADNVDDLSLFAEERRKYFFICDAFSGELFTLLRKKSCRICAPPLLIYIHGKQRSIPDTHRPLYNGSMFGAAICFTGFATKRNAISELANLVHFMGGSVRKDFSGKITHVVAHIAQGHKYKAAVNLGKNVMTEQWVMTAWENRLESNFKATAAEFVEQFQLKPFQGLKLSFLGFSPEETEHMQETTVQNGGSFLPVGSDDITHLVVEDISQPTLPDIQAIHVVRQEWFWTSIQLDACAEESLYYYVGINGTPICPAPRRKRKKLLNASDLFSPGSPGHRGSKRRSNDRTSTVSSCIYDESMNSPFSELDSPEVLRPVKPLTSRNQTCIELLQTERNYVDVLRTINKVFKVPLEKSSDHRAGSLLPPEDIKTIFGALPDLLEVHENMLTSVDKLVNNWSEDQLIGKTVVDCADGMIKAYPNFVNYFDMIKETIIRCEKDWPRFHAFLKVCLNKPECGRQTLTELLIRPVQRLPSMSLLLNDILKHTPESNEDHAYLKEAVEAIKKVLTYINEDRRKTEHQFQMFETVGGIDNCPPYILSAHRTLVSKTEVQQVVEGLALKCDHMQMFLFNDSIEIAKRRNKVAGNQVHAKSPALIPRATQQKLYKHKEFIKLSHLKSVVDITDEGEYHNMFGLVYFSNTANKDTLSVYKLIGEITKEEWVSKIVKCLSETKCTADTENYLVSVDSSELCVDKHDCSQSKERTGSIAKLIEKTRSKFGSKVMRTFSLSKTPKLQQHSNATLRRAMSSVSQVDTPMTPGTPISPSFSDYSVMEMSACEEKK